MAGIVSALTAFPKTSVTVLRGGGRDPRGNPLPVEEMTIGGCLFADRSSDEAMGFSGVVDAEAAIYRDPDPDFRFRSSDRIRIPEGSRGAGEWAVAGRVQEWPLGVMVPLRSA